MKEKSRKYLSDILRAIDLIESFVDDTNSFDEYQNDYKTQSAVERQLSIIGEAVNKFRQHCPDVDLENTKQIVGFRNRLIHAYDSIDNSIVWVIIKKYLAPLKKTVKEML
ncbi:HepT-like ribonuclease domain-containing protein [Plebeiibacterium sediminum]|uniref:DUF86 domain-containing protein n=1 Tax=Plebeiibacterium sediminum TaxID=2992112 RepID=A0AAE3SFC1_9BACT|nr:HepT-like ribonuclease domain-containing protein [Plebeiobacterium sediminum]MCW3787273.1 DUF86 domain-containing protein [Plebeiobacterium sediminum]